MFMKMQRDNNLDPKIGQTKYKHYEKSAKKLGYPLTGVGNFNMFEEYYKHH